VADVFRALLRKEWHEQRWRFFLGLIVFSGLVAGMLRAQLVPSNEAAVLLYGPVGLVFVIFLAAGPVAAERADRTWEFLIAQPVSRAEVLRAKWAIGVMQLAATMSIGTVAGLLAMWSRGFRIMPKVPGSSTEFSAESAAWLETRPALSLCAFAVVGTIALICWFTPLCLMLARARNEFAAALGGVLLTMALLLWLLQLGVGDKALLVVAALNPLSPLFLLSSRGAVFLPFLLFVHIVLWVVLPVRYLGSGRIEKWIGA
jgi:hypothetical protein